MNTTLFEILSIWRGRIKGLMNLQYIQMNMRFIVQLRARATARRPRAVMQKEGRLQDWSSLAVVVVVVVRLFILVSTEASVAITWMKLMSAPPNSIAYGRYSCLIINIFSNIIASAQIKKLIKPGKGIMGSGTGASSHVLVNSHTRLHTVPFKTQPSKHAKHTYSTSQSVHPGGH